MVLLRVGVTLAADQVAPPSAESSTYILGAPLVLSTLASSFTSMPLIVAPAGTPKAKPWNTWRSFCGLLYVALVPVPLLLSTANELSLA